jgi:hypothetical protein
MLKWFYKKKINAVLTAITILLLSLTPFTYQNVFATTGSVAKDQQVEIIIKIMTANKYSYTFLICYDTDDFTIEDDYLEILVGPVAGNWLTPSYNGGRKDIADLSVTSVSDVIGKSGSHVVTAYSSGNFPSGERPAAGTDIFKCRLTAKQAVDITDDSFYVGATVAGTNYEISSVKILDGSGSNEPQTSAYTLTATSADTNLEVNESFNVDVRLSADPAVDNWASLQADLLYDGAYVAPGADVLSYDRDGVMISQESDGQVRLLISREGEATAVGPDGVSVVRNCEIIT